MNYLNPTKYRHRQLREQPSGYSGVGPVVEADVHVVVGNEHSIVKMPITQATTAGRGLDQLGVRLPYRFFAWPDNREIGANENLYGLVVHTGAILYLAESSGLLATITRYVGEVQSLDYLFYDPVKEAARMEAVEEARRGWERQLNAPPPQPQYQLGMGYQYPGHMQSGSFQPQYHEPPLPPGFAYGPRPTHERPYVNGYAHQRPHNGYSSADFEP